MFVLISLGLGSGELQPERFDIGFARILLGVFARQLNYSSCNAATRERKGSIVDNAFRLILLGIATAAVAIVATVRGDTGFVGFRVGNTGVVSTARRVAVGRHDVEDGII